MLQIQRASAGSGKTYALAKRFIFNLLAFKNENNQWKLRNRKQIEDALTHILAITFTNKATNEMKTRIIENLSLIAKVSEGNIDENILKQTPYLEDLHKATNQEYQKIGKAAENALSIVLNNFSLFKISTIDSFFQEILRTFTYETNINESYQLEIDTGYVADAALDASFQELDLHPQNMGTASFWLKTLMQDEAQKSQKWNLFNKQNSSNSIYSKIKKSLAQLESENFKDIKKILDLYFDSAQNCIELTKLYNKLRTKGIKERKEHYDRIMQALKKIESLPNYLSYTPEQINKNFRSHITKLKELTLDKDYDFSFSNFVKAKSVFRPGYRDLDPVLDQAALDLYATLEGWNDLTQNSLYKNWKIYGRMLPYLGLIIEIRNFMSEFLDQNNLIKIGDTSYILKKIIGDEDAPFVYERLGNRIDNYLIDEFQDTSRMQWDVLYPLLKEGISKDNESLIIGDPKQSIYRFRNADHNLISYVVPQSFPDHKSAGFSKEDNTNWRSHTNIIKFNNYFFKALSIGVKNLSESKQASVVDFEDLYSNVVQHPHNQDGRGYVEINFISKPDIDESENLDEPEDELSVSRNWYDNIVLNRLGPLITSLIERGYNQKDIAILVNKNEKAQQIIKTLISYNNTLSVDKKKIEFISEESLLVSSSPAVEIIIGVLSKLNKPELKIPEKGNENTEEVVIKKRPYYNWVDIKLNFDLFCQKNQSNSKIENLICFLDNPDFEESIPGLLNQLPTPSLSSMVEAIIKSFLDESLLQSEGMYISTFQDLVTEFLAGHHNDPALFLEWWNVKSKKASVTSPDGIDAVQIMTIHKSKGLEFKCVIVPYAVEKFEADNDKEEWRWVKPFNIEGFNLPPILPVVTGRDLKNSSHERLYYEFYDQIITDKINLYYVAFTRAKNELYIFSKKNNAKSIYSIPSALELILKGKSVPVNFSEEEKNRIIDINNININLETDVISYGEPFSKEEIDEDKEKELFKVSRKQIPDIRFLDSYYINKRRPSLRSIASKSNER